MTSAYPTPLDKLTDQVRTLATELGTWPSLRQIKQQCNVGHPKAVEALATLRASGFTPSAPDGETVPIPVTERRFHVVPAPDALDTADDQADTNPAPATPVSNPAPVAIEAGDEASTVAEPLTPVQTEQVPADVTSPPPGHGRAGAVAQRPAVRDRAGCVRRHLGRLGGSG